MLYLSIDPLLLLFLYCPRHRCILHHYSSHNLVLISRLIAIRSVDAVRINMFVRSALAVEVDDDDDDDEKKKSLVHNLVIFLMMMMIQFLLVVVKVCVPSVPHLIDLSKILQNLHLLPLVEEESPVNLVVMSNLH